MQLDGSVSCYLMALSEKNSRKLRLEGESRLAAASDRSLDGRQMAAVVILLHTAAEMSRDET